MDTESLEISPAPDAGHAGASPAVEGEPASLPATAAVQAAPGGLEAVVESLLFAAGSPVPLARLVEALDGPGRAEVVGALDALGARYVREGRGVRLVQVAGGWQLRTPPEHGPFVRRLLRERPPRLSRPMLETLAIVAYRQPCTRIEIEAVRGVDADAVLATLTDRRLVRILGRKEAPGRPLLYGTTREFLEVFGLPDLAALPPLRDLGDAAAMLAAPDLTVDETGVRETAAPDGLANGHDPGAGAGATDQAPAESE